MNDALCVIYAHMTHSASLCNHNVGSPLIREDACSQNFIMSMNVDFFYSELTFLL